MFYLHDVRFFFIMFYLYDAPSSSQRMEVMIMVLVAASHLKVEI